MLAQRIKQFQQKRIHGRIADATVDSFLGGMRHSQTHKKNLKIHAFVGRCESEGTG